MATKGAWKSSERLRQVNGMLAISRALGDHQLKRPGLPNDVVSNMPDITSIALFHLSVPPLRSHPPPKNCLRFSGFVSLVVHEKYVGFETEMDL